MKKIKLLGVWISLFTVNIFAQSYVVLFKQESPALGGLEHEELENVLQIANSKSMTELKKWLGETRALRVEDFWFIRGAHIDITKEALLELKKQPWVDGVYVDHPVHAVTPINDLIIKDKLEGNSDPGLWGLEQIGIKKIRTEFPNITGKGVRVGIIDTGIQSRHPVFENTASAPSTFIGVTFKDFVNAMPSPYDDQGHGTHVAGTIAGKTVGIAPQASLTIAKVLSASGSGSLSTIVRAMQWMFDPDGDPKTKDYPQIVSNSWGMDLPTTDPFDISDFAPLHRAIQTWVRAGIFPVFAAGNSGSAPNGLPAGFPESIAVGAYDEKGDVAEFSSRGPNLWRMGDVLLSLFKPDISAPGVKITSSLAGNKFDTWSGTSMATPHVSGSLALALQVNPKLTLTQAKELLLLTSIRKVDFNYGYGMLDAYALVKGAMHTRFSNVGGTHD